RDRLAAQIIINSDIPIVWIPTVIQLKQKLTGKQLSQITSGKNKVTKFFEKIFFIWRISKPAHFYKRTHQSIGEGKNLWSLPAFLKAVGKGEKWMTFVRGTMH